MTIFFHGEVEALSKEPLLSVIIPMYNEEPVIAETHRRLGLAVQTLNMDCELIYVNDGSRDQSADIIRSIIANDTRVRLIDFARNFGHQYAVSAGLEHASGDAVVIIDADLQDPPELISDMVRMWREGADVVYGQRTERKGDSAFKKFSAFAFYRILDALSGVKIPPDTGDFRLMDRKVVDVLKSMPEHNRFMRGIVAWVGFKQVPLHFSRDPRWAGETKYPLSKMLKLAWNGIFAFSDLPVKLPLNMGCFVGAVSALYLLIILVLAFMGKYPGFAHVGLAVTTLLTAAILISVGLVGEYVVRIADEARGRPIYIIRSLEGFAQAKNEE